MFKTALRWMGARWWAAAALAATTIVLFRMTEVDAPSPLTPRHSILEWNDPAAAGVVEASFRKDHSAVVSIESDLEFLGLRGEIANLESALRWERERASLYSHSYESVKRQYSEIARLANLLMVETQEEPIVRVRTSPQQAMVERAVAQLRRGTLETEARPAAFHRPQAAVSPGAAPRALQAIMLEPAKEAPEANQ